MRGRRASMASESLDGAAESMAFAALSVLFSELKLYLPSKKLVQESTGVGNTWKKPAFCFYHHSSLDFTVLGPINRSILTKAAKSCSRHMTTYSIPLSSLCLCYLPLWFLCEGVYDARAGVNRLGRERNGREMLQDANPNSGEQRGGE